MVVDSAEMITQSEFQSVTLHPIDRASISFSGRLVAMAEGSASNPSQHGRRHRISVYEAIDGKLHIQIDFLTNSLHERPTTVVESNLHLFELDDLLAVYDPATDLNQGWVRPRHKSQAVCLRKSLWNAYDQLAIEIQKQLSGFVANPSTSDDEFDLKATASRWFGWLPFTMRNV